MNVELVTKSDLDNLRDTLLKELRSLVGIKPDTKKYLKSSEVRNILSCSPGTLQHLRVSGTIEYTKIGGTIYYSSDSVNAVFEKNKRSVA
jgi:hypothetical protein